MKRFISRLLLALCALYSVVAVASAGWSFFRCELATSRGDGKTYENKEYGYRLRDPEGWGLWDRGGAYLCSPWIGHRCGPSPHEVYATVGVEIRDAEGLPLADYLRSPGRGNKDLR